MILTTQQSSAPLISSKTTHLHKNVPDDLVLPGAPCTALPGVPGAKKKKKHFWSPGQVLFPGEQLLCKSVILPASSCAKEEVSGAPRKRMLITVSDTVLGML